MKRAIVIVSVLLVLASLVGCGATAGQVAVENPNRGFLRKSVILVDPTVPPTPDAVATTVAQLAVEVKKLQGTTNLEATPVDTDTDAATEPTETPAPPPATVASDNTAGEWEEIDFHPSGDRQDVVNVDHDGQHRVTIAWFFAGPANNGTPETACTMHVTTDPEGEKITFKGAFRTWEWTGSTAPTKENIQSLVESWVKVLENEPRGMCAKEGTYEVTWQDASLAP